MQEYYYAQDQMFDPMQGDTMRPWQQFPVLPVTQPPVHPMHPQAPAGSLEQRIIRMERRLDRQDRRLDRLTQRVNRVERLLSGRTDDYQYYGQSY